MAVIQISKIQVRRGLQENLPQLASGEMGWSVDERRLWIGNGSLAEGAPEEGNTEILTSRSNVLQAIESYIFRGTESGYTSRTGPNALSPVARTLQEKFDDLVNFRDFITNADRTSGDYTAALQRAIDQTFPKGYDSDSQAGVRRVLHIPAGKWKISNVTVPPYATLEGDGKNSTILWGNISIPATASVLEVRDSQGNVGTLVNTTTSLIPSNVTIKGMTIQSTTGANVVTLQSCRTIRFDDVAFIGANAAPVDFGTVTYGVGIGPTMAGVRDISLRGCTFNNTHFGLIAIYQSQNITASECVFDNLTVGVYGLGPVNSPQIRVVNSYFSNIAQSAVGSANGACITSAFNYYDRVGFGNGTVMDSGTPVHPVFSWDNSTNHSVNDIIKRTAAEEATQPIYQFSNLLGAGEHISHSASGAVRSTTGYKTKITDGATVSSELSIPANHSAIIDYRIQRSDGSNIQSRVGSVKVTHLGGNYYYDEEYTETANVGITFSYASSGTGIAVSFSASSTGQDAYASYSAKYIY